MANNYWMKLWFDILNDPKMGTLPDRLWRRVIELFLLAGQNGKDGELPDLKSISWILKLNVRSLQNDLKRIQETGIVHETDSNKWIVTNFQKRNARVETAKRVKDFRQRERTGNSNASDNADVTIRYVNGNENEKLSYQEEQRNRSTDINYSTPPLPPTEFMPFANVYKNITGDDPKITPDEIDAITEIIKAGGTVGDYQKALQGMQKKDYTIGSMTSALNWTLKDIEKRKNGKKKREPDLGGYEVDRTSEVVFIDDGEVIDDELHY